MGDKVQGIDIHIIMIPTPGGPVPTPLPSPFSGTILQGTSTDVLIEKMPAATVDSVAVNMPPHIPAGGPFMKPPSNQGKVLMGSATVLINGKPAARMGDMVQDCNDPVDLPTGAIVCSSTVLIGGPPSPTGMAGGGGAAVAEQSFEPVKGSSPKTTQQGEEKQQTQPAQKGKGSLSVTCVDKGGNPVADCEYEMVLPGGQKKKGKTDSDGKILEEGIDPGSCEITFYPT